MDSPAPSTVATDAARRIAQLLCELRASSSALDSARHTDRLAVYAPVTLGVVCNRDEFKTLYRAWATDLSSAGIGLLGEQPLDLGLEMFINLQSLTGGPCVLPVRVVYTKQLLPHTYRIGATFGA